MKRLFEKDMHIIEKTYPKAIVEPDTSKEIMLFHVKGLNDVSTDTTSKNNGTVMLC